MEASKQFFSLLAVLKRKLIIEHVSRNLHLGLLLLSSLSLIIALLARVFVIEYLSEILIVSSCVLISVSVVVSFFTKPGNYTAATLFDDYVGEDRVKTALTYINDESVMSILQRRDTLSYMKNQMTIVEKRKIRLFYWKKLAIICAFFTITTISLYFPNDVMKTAAEQEIDKKVIKETKRELKKLTSQDMSKELEDLKKLEVEAKTSEELLEKLVQQEKELEKKKQAALNENQRLKELSEEMKDFEKLSKALNNVNPELLKIGLDELKKDIPVLTDKQQKALQTLLSELTNQTVPSLSELSEEQLDELLQQVEDNLEKMMANANELSELTNLQQQVQQMATSLNQNMASAGLQSSNQLSFASSSNSTNQSSGNSQQSQNGQNQSGNSSNNNGQPQNGQGQGNNGQSQNGQGQGNGSGQGAGSGSGNGGSGSGGNGTGTGSGAGFGQGARNLTIPEKIEGDQNVENDFGKTGEGSGEQQVAPDGPVLKGSVRPYEEVYGEYEQSYRESVDRMDLPGYLEDVVKDYFSELNPGGE